MVCDGEASRVAEETKRQKPKRLVANVTDPESRLQKTRRGFIQGYNAQAVVSADQVVIACDVTNNTTDQAQLEPMLGAAKTNVGEAGITVAIGSALADAGYASYTNFEAESRLGMSLLIATSRGAKIAKCNVERSDTERDSERIELFERIEAGECTIAEAATTLGLSRSWVSQLVGRYRNHGDLGSESMLAWREMTQRLAQPLNRDLYKQRGWMIEGSFAHTKTNRGFDTFTRHGLEPCRAEWTLINLAGNIKKLHKRHHTPTTRPTPPAEPADSPENGSSNSSAPDRCHPKRRPHQQHPTPSRCTRCQPGKATPPERGTLAVGGPFSLILVIRTTLYCLSSPVLTDPAHFRRAGM